MNKFFDNKTVLITGGTGSFGSAVIKKFINTSIKEIKVFSRDEKKQEDMRLKLNNEKLKFYIGDIRDEISIRKALKNVDYVFHAAALKQVPSCEFYPMEAVKTNILGTENLLSASIDNNVEKVVLLSTDKAVYPINAMGLTKSLMEKLMIASSRETNSRTVFCATRYGNVMASRGSVIPLFISQIKNKEPLTITDPSMTRYLMSLDESLDLVLHAFENGNKGDIFVQKAVAASVGDLARALLEIFDSKQKIKIIGTRHGEKLFETLVSREEMLRVEDMGKYFRIPADSRDLNYNKYFTEGDEAISQLDDYTSHNTKRLDINEVISLLEKLDYIKESI